MKKLLLLFAAAITLGHTHGQITLTSNSIGAVGSTYYLGVDTLLAVGYDIGTPGTNLTWDFTQLDQDFYDTIHYIDPASTPYAGDFPSANLAVERATQAGALAFFEKTTSEFLLLGIAADFLGTGMPLTLYQMPSSKSATFPWTYGSVLYDTSTISFKIDASFLGFPGVDSAEYISETIREVHCDSWGNLMLWGNSYPALRNKEVKTTHDILNARFFFNWTNFQDTTYTDSTFTWINDTKGFTLAEAVYTGGVLESISYQDANPVAINNRIDAATILYPNPAHDQVMVVNQQGSIHKVRVFDLEGRIVREQLMNGTQTTISLQDLAPGIFLLQGLDENELVVLGRKLVVR